MPDPNRRGEIHFLFAKSMPYHMRLSMIGLFLLAGFAIQIFWNQLAVGAALLLMASMLGLVKGYTNNPGNLGGKREWRTGDKAQLQKIIDIAKKTRKWDQSVLDITCSAGCCAWVVMVVLIGFFGFVVFSAGYEQLGLAVWVNTSVLLIPHWITGVRKILINAPLTIKVENLLNVYSIWEAEKKDDEKMMVQMEVIKSEKGEMPVDAKLILQIPALSETFFGVQTQVVLNNVQGADFPYLYCVLVAKTVMGMPNTLMSVASDAEALYKLETKGLGFFTRKPLGIITEWKQEGGMDILIIRQQTTQQTGYQTDPAAVARIFRFAKAEARKLLK